MKKILLFFAALACTAASWAADEVTAVYTSSKLDVALTNATEFVAFQMDITLEGATPGALTAEALRLTKEGTATIGGSSVAAPFELASNVLSNGKLRVIAYNLANRSISLSEGTLFSVALNGKPTSVTIDNVLFVKKADLAEIELAAKATEGADYVVGDITGDGKVNVKDVNAIVAIVNDDINPNYNLDAADVNKDGKYNVKDVNAIVSIINE